MEKGSSSVRDRLLASLPQPEDIAAYREKVASLLAKHEKAIFWENWSFQTLLFCAFVLAFTCISDWGQRLDHRASVGFYTLTGLMFFGSMTTGLRYYINRSKVDILKEVKQLQLQVLELQASLQKGAGR
jgi:hypothetical protein